MNQIQEIAIQTVYDGLNGILDGLSFQDSKLAEVSHLADAVIEMRGVLYEAFPESIEKYISEYEKQMNLDPEISDGMSDVEADADALKSAGLGTDEDYGMCGNVGNEEHF